MKLEDIKVGMKVKLLGKHGAYDNNGNLLKTYEGKIDVQDTEYGNKVLFDLTGERVVIYNATVIVEEQ